MILSIDIRDQSVGRRHTVNFINKSKFQAKQLEGN